MKKIRELLEKDFVISLEEGIGILGNDKAVYRLVEKGELVKLEPNGLGYFASPLLEEGTAQFAILTKYYPQCVVSGRTALSLYDMGLDYIKEIDVNISNKTSLKNSLFNVSRVVDSKMNNIITRSFQEKNIPFEIKIYSPERTLFEAHKYYKGLDSYFYSINQYKKLYLNKSEPGDQYDTILNINKKIGREIIDFLMIGN